ncbi:MAG: DUF1624 domain-containing protein [Planctomycetes bacterium]|nr:DUF1624 domain-containing protein [Planctomycetota bacterium]
MDTRITKASRTASVPPAMAAPRPERIESIDLLRGVVMIIMALDHVRDFYSERLLMDPTDLNTTTVGIFLTRWITHFCAPTFIFLAGTSAFLAGTRGKSKPALSWFLFTRGLWLAFFEVVINRAMWMFNYDLHHHGAGVFWAIGWSMVGLSVLVYLPTPVVTIFGLSLVGLHNMLDGLTAEQVGLPGWLWVILHSPGNGLLVGGTIAPASGAGAIASAGLLGVQAPFHTAAALIGGSSEDFTFGTGYCLIPWMGTMACGYGFGSLFLLPRPRRRFWLFLLGAALTLLFLELRAVNQYGDPRHWAVQSRVDQSDIDQISVMWSFLSFLNCTKYPASLLYLLMTLGPAILFLAAVDFDMSRSHGSHDETGGKSLLHSLTRPVLIFGRVPLFYYLLHIPLIHGGAVLLDCYRFGWSPLADSGPWFSGAIKPMGYGVSLPMVYLIWIGVLLILYLPCRWFAGVKQRSRSVWLSYF